MAATLEVIFVYGKGVTVTGLERGLADDRRPGWEVTVPAFRCCTSGAGTRAAGGGRGIARPARRPGRRRGGATIIPTDSHGREQRASAKAVQQGPASGRDPDPAIVRT